MKLGFIFTLGKAKEDDKSVVADDVSTLASEDVNTLDSGYNSSMGEQGTKSPSGSTKSSTVTSPQPNSGTYVLFFLQQPITCIVHDQGFKPIFSRPFKFTSTIPHL